MGEKDYEGDFVLYKVVTDNGSPELMVGRDLADIVESCNEWCGVINSVEFVAYVSYITSEAFRFAEEGDKPK